MATIHELIKKANTANFGKEEKVEIYLPAFQNALIEAYFEGCNRSVMSDPEEHLNKFLGRTLKE